MSKLLLRQIAVTALIIIFSGLVTVAVIDILGYLFLPDSYSAMLPNFRHDSLSSGNNPPPIARGYPRWYFKEDKKAGFDISENAQASITVEDINYSIFSNSFGCFDRNEVADFSGHEYAYFAGDSFTWGYAAYADKFATRFEVLTGMLSAKCGVTHTGTRHQFEKFQRTTKKIDVMPSLVIVGFFDNDLQNDFAYPHTTVIQGCLVDTAYVQQPHTLQINRPDITVLQEEVSRQLNKSGNPLLQRTSAKPGRYNIFAELGDWLQRNSFTFNLLNYSKMKVVGLWNQIFQAEIIQPIDRPPKFGYRIYQLAEPGLREPYLNPIMPYEKSLLAGANQKAIVEWKAHAVRNGYRLVMLLIPPKEFSDNTNHFSELREFLASQDVEYLDLTVAFRNNGLSTKDLYWASDPHLNDKGNRTVGKIIADYFSKKNLP